MVQNLMSLKKYRYCSLAAWCPGENFTGNHVLAPSPTTKQPQYVSHDSYHNDDNVGLPILELSGRYIKRFHDGNH